MISSYVCAGTEFPFSSVQGAIIGFVTALVFGMVMSFGAFSAGNQPEPLPSSVAGCEANLTSLVPSVTPTTSAQGETTPSPLETKDLR